MEKSYTILRINEDIKTITVMLKANGFELQQDIPFVDTKEEFEDAVKYHLDKLESDLTERAKETETKAPDFEFTIGKEVVVE